MESQKYEVSVDLDEDDITDEEESNQISQNTFSSTALLKCKGRGFTDNYPRTIYTLNQNMGYDSLKSQSNSGNSNSTTITTATAQITTPTNLHKYQKSIEGWVLFVSGLHEEITEDDLHDKFSEFGHIIDLKLELDHKTGYVKGYALIEYENYSEALSAKENLNNSSILDMPIRVDFAYLSSINSSNVNGGNNSGNSNSFHRMAK